MNELVRNIIKDKITNDYVFSFSITLCPVDHQASFSISETSNKAQALAWLVTDSFGRELPSEIEQVKKVASALGDEYEIVSVSISQSELAKTRKPLTPEKVIHNIDIIESELRESLADSEVNEYYKPTLDFCKKLVKGDQK